MPLGNWIKENTSTSGTGIITLAGAPSNAFAEFADVIGDGELVDYFIEDGDNREAGRGTFTLSGTTLARTTVLSTLVSGVYDNTAPTAISLSGSAVVYIGVAAENIVDKYDTAFANAMYKVGATLNGTATTNHINLGDGTSVTGTAAQAYDHCTISGGNNQTASGSQATVAGGDGCTSSGELSFSAGNGCTASNIYAIAMGSSADATFRACIAMGNNPAATAWMATAIGGDNATASGQYAACIGGNNCDATANQAYTIGGKGAGAGHVSAGALGGAPATRADYDLVLGATDSSTASNANNTIRLQGTGGNLLIDGTTSSPEADYAEMFEWFDGNPDDEDRVGYFVSLHEGKIVKGAGRDDKTSVANYLASIFTSPNSATSVPMVGVISGNPSVIGDAAPNHWKGRIPKDKFGRKQFNEYTKHTWLTSEGEPQTVYVSTQDGQKYLEHPQYTHAGIATNIDIPVEAVATAFKFPQVDPTYQPETPYTPRIDRQEWSAVGMLGKLVVHSAEPITSAWVKPAVGGKALNAASGEGYQVLEVIDNYTVRILFK